MKFSHSTTQLISRNIIVALIYAAMCKLMLGYFSENGVVSLMWASSGFSLGVLLLGGLRYWPGICLGALLGNLLSGSALALSVAISIGNTLEAITGYYLINLNNKFDIGLNNPKDYWRLSFAATISCLVSATIGVSSLHLAGITDSASFFQNLAHWWQGDFLGILLITPLMLVWRDPPEHWFSQLRFIETFSCFGLSWLFGQIIFVGWFEQSFSLLAHAYVMFPFIVWAAVRYGRHGSLLIISMSAAQGLIGLVNHRGFFTRNVDENALVNFWLYLMVMSLVGITLSLVIHRRRASEAQLKKNNALLTKLSHQVPGMIYQFQMFPDGRACFPYTSEHIRDIYEVSPEEVVHDASIVFERLYIEDRKAIEHSIQESASAMQPWGMEYRVMLPEKGLQWRVGHANPEQMPDGSILWHGCITDITKRKEEESRLRMTEFSISCAADQVFWVTRDARIEYANDAACQALGYSREELTKLSIPQIDPYYTADGWPQHWEELRKNKSLHFDTVHTSKDGCNIPVEIIANHFEFDGKEYNCAFVRDISERKKTEAQMLQLAHYDTVTGIPNRALFLDRLEQEIKKSHRTGLPMALMFIDLDHFKEINDTLGHDIGDMLLKETAKRLLNCVRETDTVARLGGDEFTVVLGQLDDVLNVEKVASALLNSLAIPFQLGSEMVYISASIGITLYPNDALTTEGLLKHADQAMYSAKSMGRNRYSYFTESMQENAQTRMRLTNDLRNAISHQEFFIAYQPIIEMATGYIHKAEALIRWKHPTRGLISPLEFIPIAEDSGLIIEIGKWVFEQAAIEVKHLRETHHIPFQISVNKSPVQFNYSGASTADWFDYLHSLGLPGQSICVEITEGMLMDASPASTNKLLAFRDTGIQVSLDDFGTGYSSLAYLKKFDIDYLKIDQSFVRNLTPNSEDFALCEAIIVMAHKLNIKVIAEGIETEEQAALLKAAGCDYGQGYLFSKPVPATELDAMLHANAASRRQDASQQLVLI